MEYKEYKWYEKRLLITGQTQSGKTEYLKFKLRNVPRYVCYDPDEHLSAAEFGIQCADTTHLKKLLDKGERRIVYVPSDDVMANFDDRADEFDEMCEIINDDDYHDRDNPLTFAIDEIATVTLPPGKRTPVCPEQFAIAIKRKMKKGLGLFATTQRLKDCDVDFITQAQIIVMFRLMKHDIRYIQEKVGIDFSPLILGAGKSQADYSVKPVLKRWHYIYFDNDTKETYIGHLELETRARETVGRKWVPSSPAQSLKNIDLGPRILDALRSAKGDGSGNGEFGA